MLFTFMLHSQLPYKPQKQHSVLILPSFSCEDKHDYLFLYVQGLLCLTVSPFMVSTYVIILCSCSSLLLLLGLSLLRNQRETLAIQANLF